MNLNKQNFIYKCYNLIKGFLNKLNEDHVSAFAAQSSFFLIMTIFPFIMLILSLLKYTPITEAFLIGVVNSIVPSNFHNISSQIITQLYAQGGIGLLSVTAIASLWASSKGILSLMKGFDCIYKTDDKRNYFILRLVATLYTIIFIVGIVLSLVILVFGNSLLSFFREYEPILYNATEFLISIRGLYIPLILTIIFVLFYKLVPNKNFRFVDHIPGALFSALGWEIFSYAYSIYIDYYSGHTSIYGPLTTAILLLLWLYFCMYILFLGAEINVYFRRHFQMAKQIVRQIKDDTKDELREDLHEEIESLESKIKKH